MKNSLSMILMGGTIFGTVHSQTFGDVQSNISYPDVSQKCAAALNSSIKCLPILSTVAPQHKWLNEEQLSAMCTESCHHSLLVMKDFIDGNCTAKEDVIVKEGVVYPAIYAADSLLLAFDRSCMKDPDTGMFCDATLMSWLGHGHWKPEYNCHECTLGLERILLKSPLTYQVALAMDHNSTAVACGLAPPEVDPPEEYALNRTMVVDQAADGRQKRPCDSSYDLKSGDTCSSIGLAKNVSTFGITQQNNLNAWCSNLHEFGSRICLPKRCKVYQVQKGQNCWDVMVASGGGLSVAQLKQWNPRLNPVCTNMQDLAGQVVCVSAPGKPIPAKFVGAKADEEDPYLPKQGTIGKYPEIPADKMEEISKNPWNMGYSTSVSDSMTILVPTSTLSYSTLRPGVSVVV